MELEATLRADLERSGIFRILSEEELRSVQLSGAMEKDAEFLRSIGATMALRSELKVEGDRLILEGRLFDLASRQSVLGKRYRGTFDLARRIAHTFADEIVLYLTGRRGIALTSIAFVSDRDGSKEIYLMDYDGHDQRRVTGHRSISLSPAWHPQGDRLAYVSFFGGSPGLYLADLVSGKKTPIATEGSLNISPSISPDGKLVAFARALGSNIEIFVSHLDGSGLRRLTNSPGIDTNPAWSPNGQEIAFTSSRGGTPQIYVMDAEGANVRRLTFEGDYCDQAAWSPDGTRIAFATRVEPNRFDIALLDVVSLSQMKLTQGPASNESPTFAPDGRRLAYAAKQRGSVQIVVQALSPNVPAEVLTFRGNNSSPRWSSWPR
jgi:TolB protein